MSYTKTQAISLQARINAIYNDGISHGLKSLTSTQWQGVSDAAFTPNGALTYLTSQEFADSIQIGGLTGYVPRGALTITNPLPLAS
jgi:chromosome segregation and condensation protein ScpB